MPPPNLSAILDRPIREFDLPVRMVAFATRRGLHSLRELAGLDPWLLLGEPNLAYTSLKATSRQMKRETGLTWEHLVTQLTGVRCPALRLKEARAVASNKRRVVPVGDPEHAGETRLFPWATRPEAWQRLDALVPDALRETPLTDVPDLSARMMSFARCAKATTLGELVKIDPKVFATAPNLGRTSITTTVLAVHAFLGVPFIHERDRARPEPEPEPRAEPEPKTEPTLLAFWRKRVASLSGVRQLVLRHRAGADTEALSRREVAELLGLTGDYVRQLETRGLRDITRGRPSIEAIAARLGALLPTATLAVDALVAADPWFIDVRDATSFARFFFDRVLKGRYHLIELDGVAYVATYSMEALEAYCKEYTKTFREGPWPATWTVVEARIAAATGDFGPAAAKWFAERERPNLRFDPADPARLVGYGHLHEHKVEGLLRAAGAPVRVSEIHARLGRGPLPESLVYVSSFHATLPEFLHGFDACAKRVLPLCVRWMRKHGATRQWAVGELVTMLATKTSLPDWFGRGPLTAMLSQSKRVHRISRFVVVLAESAHKAVTLRETIRQVLKRARGPLSMTNLRARVRALRGCSDATFKLTLGALHLVVVAPGMWGLPGRDLPDAAEGAPLAVALVLDCLAARGRGLFIDDCLARVRTRSPIFKRWTPSMLYSVLRTDERLQTYAGRYVGLPGWDRTHMPTIRNLLAYCLEEGGGTTTVRAFTKRVADFYGDTSGPNLITQAIWNSPVVKTGDVLVAKKPSAGSGTTAERPPMR